jgi:Tfp pilus assembly protein PilP
MGKIYSRLSFAAAISIVLMLTAVLVPNLVEARKKSTSAPLKKIEVLTPEKLATLDEKGFIFTYDSLGRKDPFQPFINFTQIERAIPTENNKPLTALEKFSLNQYKLVGIILAGDKHNYALVEDPDNLGITVHEGDMIGNMSGRVKEIKLNELIVEEPYLDIFDKEQLRTVVIKLRDLEEESYLSLDEED